MPLNLRLAALLAFLLPACAPANELVDGDICVDPAVAAAFSPGEDLTVQVVLDECTSACVRKIESTCDVEVDGTTIHLDARGSFKDPIPGRSCVAVCGQLVAQCVLPELAAGTYELHSGGQVLTLTLPAAEPPVQADACGFNGV